MSEEKIMIQSFETNVKIVLSAKDFVLQKENLGKHKLWVEAGETAQQEVRQDWIGEK